MTDKAKLPPSGPIGISDQRTTYRLEVRLDVSDPYRPFDEVIVDGEKYVHVPKEGSN